MYSRSCSLLSACLAVLVVGKLSAGMTSPKVLLPGHLDWIGTTDQSITRDGSVLSEYTAQTASLDTDGAILSISMTPRFSCLPITAITINDLTISSDADEVEFVAVVDNQTFSFPTIPDRNGVETRYTLGSNGADQKKARNLLDLTSRATFKWSVNSDIPRLSTDNSDDQANGVVNFSLLGSQRTLAAMEEMCRSHAPVALIR